MKLESTTDDLDQLPHSDMVRDQEFCLVQDWKLFLSTKPLNDARNLGGMLSSDLLNILHSQS